MAERALHGTALAEHAVVDEAGREPLQCLLDHIIFFGDKVVIATVVSAGGVGWRW